MMPSLACKNADDPIRTPVDLKNTLCSGGPPKVGILDAPSHILPGATSEPVAS